MKIHLQFILLFFWHGLIFLSAPVYGQTVSDEVQFRPAPDTDRICQLPPTDLNAHRTILFEDIAKKRPAILPAADFEITFADACNGSSWPAEAMNAFEYAAEIWATYIESSVPVKVEAIWDDIDVLGQAGPTLVVHSSNIPSSEPETWYPIAQASAMTGIDFVTLNSEEEYDIRVRMNCTFADWYFNTDGNPGSGKIDFVTVVLHELGHGLDFIGTMRADEDDQTAEWGIQDQPIIYDRFAVDGDGIRVVNESIYANPSQELYEAVTGRRGGLMFSGIDAERMYGGLPPPLYAPASWSSGSSFSHLDDDSFRNTENALMRPRIDRAFAIHTPGPVFCGMLSDKGWPLGENCDTFINMESVIAVAPESVDFELTNIGKPVERSVIVRNEEDAEDPLEGRAELHSDDYTIIAGGGPFELEPGVSREIRVQFNPVSVGEKQGILYLYHNASNRFSPVEVGLSGNALDEDVLAQLEQNYPNPFRSTTRIHYGLPDDSRVVIDLFDSTGRRVKTLVDANQSAGRHDVTLDTHGLSSGVYIYRILVNGFVASKQMTVVR